MKSKPSSRVTFVADAVMRRDLRIAAGLDGCSRADVIRRAVLEFIRRKQEQTFQEFRHRRLLIER